MASPTAIQFIELVLSNTNTTSDFNLSYTDPHQKWIIRKHLLSLLRDFPFFTPSFGSFVHNDGTAFSLLCVTGDLPLTPPVPLTIWLHHNHPLTPPMVFVTVTGAAELSSSNRTNRASTIRRDHPFVNFPSGSTTCPYLETWSHPRCSPSNLVRNLVNLFSHDHPFVTLSRDCNVNFAHPSLVSKREALDRLVGSIHYDVAAFTAAAERENRALAKLRAEMAERAGVAEGVIIRGLEEEKEKLRGKVRELTEQADVVMSWLRVNRHVTIGDDQIEKAFEGVEADSEAVLECLAADRGAEDVIYALDKAVEEGVVSLEGYIRQVRALAREQFYHRAMLEKLRGSTSLLHWPY